MELKKGFKEFLLVVFPKIFGGIGTIGLNIVLMRFLGGEEAAPYGIYSFCATAILLADGVLGSAFDMGVLRLAPLYRTSNPDRSYAIERMALGMKFWVVFTVAGLLSIFARPISRLFFNDPESQHLVYISCCAAMGLLMLRSTQLHLQVDRRFHLYGLVDFLHHFLKFGGIGVVLSIYKASPANVLAWFAIAPAAVFFVFIGTLGRRLFFERSHQRGVFKEFFGYVHWFVFTFSLTSIVARMDMLLLPIISKDLNQVGIFGAALVIAFIAELLGMYIGVVTNPRIMPYFRQRRLPAFYRNFQILFTAGAVLFYIVTWLSMPLLKTYVLPQSLMEAARVVMILLPGALATMVSFPLTFPLLMFLRPRFIVIMEAILLIPTILLNIYAISRYGAVGAASVTASVRVLKAVICQWKAWQLAHLPPEEVPLEEFHAF